MHSTHRTLGGSLLPGNKGNWEFFDRWGIDLTVILCAKSVVLQFKCIHGCFSLTGDYIRPRAKHNESKWGHLYCTLDTAVDRVQQDRRELIGIKLMKTIAMWWQHKHTGVLEGCRRVFTQRADGQRGEPVPDHQTRGQTVIRVWDSHNTRELPSVSTVIRSRRGTERINTTIQQNKSCCLFHARVLLVEHNHFT